MIYSKQKWFYKVDSVLVKNQEGHIALAQFKAMNSRRTKWPSFQTANKIEPRQWCQNRLAVGERFQPGCTGFLTVSRFLALLEQNLAIV